MRLFRRDKPGLVAIFQSTHPIRGATYQILPGHLHRGISIHAPHTGCDLRIHNVFKLYFDISIHAPHTGCDDCPRPKQRHRGHFNPRTPYGVRRRKFFGSHLRDLFQSTHPIRGATTIGTRETEKLRLISIHAPHTGCDIQEPRPPAQRIYFNPRTPYGVRLIIRVHCPKHGTFQSTHPIRGATTHSGTLPEARYISIHAPHTGCDLNDVLAMDDCHIFQSTHPIRGATWMPLPQPPKGEYFNPRTPYGVRPVAGMALAFGVDNFNPRTPYGVRL